MPYKNHEEHIEALEDEVEYVTKQYLELEQERDGLIAKLEMSNLELNEIIEKDFAEWQKLKREFESYKHEIANQRYERERAKNHFQPKDLVWVFLGLLLGHGLCSAGF